ncbi:uncharacterized protein B0P05DRAFT_523280 [Gilbertella persicaria]|uniref:uncharacterized protein n=1 Tax=Gilbertella persicaria TaxID=101096 RepID=UPI00222092C7|nr:uncharacterized protein B0P05DRAFT_523280 [Gilbertella persicaria]KAI8098067.1 hypothetical protein B0P05DRAFT_523280 [Gilbertella persicaria]
MIKKIMYHLTCSRFRFLSTTIFLLKRCLVIIPKLFVLELYVLFILVCLKMNVNCLIL